MTALKRTISDLENVRFTEVKRVKYLLKQEDALKAELDSAKSRLKEKSEILLELNAVLQDKTRELEEYQGKLDRIKCWQETYLAQTNQIEKQKKEISRLQEESKSSRQSEAVSYAQEIKQLREQLALEKASRRRKWSEQNRRTKLSALEQSYKRTIIVLNRLREKNQKEELMFKELHDVRQKVKKVEQIEVKYIRAKQKLEDCNRINSVWRTTISSFFEDSKEIKTPEEAKHRFALWEEKSLNKPDSSLTAIALKDKSKKYKTTIAKMQRKIKELTRALEQNTKSVEFEKTQALEAERLKLKAKYKEQSLQKLLRLLKQEL